MSDTWTPNQPLPHDATDEQIRQRWRYVGAMVTVAREYAEACVAERERKWEDKARNWMASPEAATRLDGYRELAGRLATSEATCDALRAEVERLRKRLGEVTS